MNIFIEKILEVRWQDKASEKSTKTPLDGSSASLNVISQQQQITINKLLAGNVILEDHATSHVRGLVSAGHVTTIFQEELIAKIDEFEMYSRRPFVILMGYQRKKMKI